MLRGKLGARGGMRARRNNQISLSVSGGLSGRAAPFRPVRHAPPRAGESPPSQESSHSPQEPAGVDASTPIPDYHHTVDIEQFRKMGYEMVDMICDYYTSLESLPVRDTAVKPGYLAPLLPPEAPEQPEPWQEVVADLKTTVRAAPTRVATAVRGARAPLPLQPRATPLCSVPLHPVPRCAGVSCSAGHPRRVHVTSPAVRLQRLLSC